MQKVSNFNYKFSEFFYAFLQDKISGITLMPCRSRALKHDKNNCDMITTAFLRALAI